MHTEDRQAPGTSIRFQSVAEFKGETHDDPQCEGAFPNVGRRA